MKTREKKILYALGYYEDENYIWRCKKCNQRKIEVECSCDICKGRCEWCYWGA